MPLVRFILALVLGALLGLAACPLPIGHHTCGPFPLFLLSASNWTENKTMGWFS
jgi:hypothetical protein